MEFFNLHFDDFFNRPKPLPKRIKKETNPTAIPIPRLLGSHVIRLESSSDIKKKKGRTAL